jgi:hypothetical protein
VTVTSIGRQWFPTEYAAELERAARAISDVH